MCETDDIENPLNFKDGGLPKGGFEFINKSNYDGLGVYHCHLSNIGKSVLLWYLNLNNNGINLKFKYITPHPNDMYKSVLNEIYNESESFDIKKCIFLNENKHLLELNFNENYIIKFIDFIKNK